MKLSEMLFSAVEDIWKESVKKPFVIEMAKGTLDDVLFRNYMLQDYLYLLEYLEILEKLRDLSPDDGAFAFLEKITEGTRQEFQMVHIPNMKRTGISDEEIRNAVKLKAVSDYTGFMRSCLENEGFLGGLTALLQCSWIYAYISEDMMRRFGPEISGLKYAFWFEAYSCDSYLDTNRMWIELLNKESANINEAGRERLCSIFTACADHENELWDALYSPHPNISRLKA